MKNKILHFIDKYYKFAILALFICSLFFIISRFLSVLSLPDSSYNFAEKDKTRLYPDYPITQKFIAKKNNLNQINILLNNVKLKSSDKIIFKLSDESCSQLISETELTASNDYHSIFNHFSFPVISDSQNKMYCFMITYMPEKENLKKSSYPEVVTNLEMLFAEPFKNSRPSTNEKAASLVMRPAYTNGNIFDDLYELIGRISQYKPWFLKGIYIEAIIVLFFLLTITFVILVILL